MIVLAVGCTIVQYIANFTPHRKAINIRSWQTETLPDREMAARANICYLVQFRRRNFFLLFGDFFRVLVYSALCLFVVGFCPHENRATVV